MNDEKIIKEYLDKKETHRIGFEYIVGEELREAYVMAKTIQEALEKWNSFPKENTGTLINVWLDDLNEYIEEEKWTEQR